jgi:hypothetical protein
MRRRLMRKRLEKLIQIKIWRRHPGTIFIIDEEEAGVRLWPPARHERIARSRV